MRPILSAFIFLSLAVSISAQSQDEVTSPKPPARRSYKERVQEKTSENPKANTVSANDGLTKLITGLYVSDVSVGQVTISDAGDIKTNAKNITITEDLSQSKKNIVTVINANDSAMHLVLERNQGKITSIVGTTKDRLYFTILDPAISNPLVGTADLNKGPLTLVCQRSSEKTYKKLNVGTVDYDYECILANHETCQNFYNKVGSNESDSARTLVGRCQMILDSAFSNAGSERTILPGEDVTIYNQKKLNGVLEVDPTTYSGQIEYARNLLNGSSPQKVLRDSVLLRLTKKGDYSNQLRSHLEMLSPFINACELYVPFKSEMPSNFPAVKDPKIP